MKTITIKTVLTFILCIMVGANAMALSVGDLRVQSAHNPQGIDDEPEFSWKLYSDERGVVQTAYKIVVSQEADGSNPIYNSGYIESEQNVAVKLSGLTLSPSTRYYWTVSVKDNKGKEAISSELAYFDTGLMSSGWGNAVWIKATDIKYGHAVPVDDAITDYTVEAKFNIEAIAAGIIFCQQDDSHYYMWQFNIEQAHPRFRPHRWNGGGACLDNIDLTGVVDLKAGEEYNVKIVVTNADHAVTYLNGIKIDERDGDFTYGKMGVRASYAESGDRKAEAGYYDDFKITRSDGTIVYNEDFSETANPYTAGQLRNGKLYVQGISGGGDVKALPSNNPEVSTLHYAIDYDMDIVNASAAIIFGYKSSDTYYMWQINCKDNANPSVRHHVYNNGSLDWNDSQFTQFTKDQLVGHKHHYRVEVDHDQIKTYVDGILVDTYTDKRGGAPMGDIGLRIDPTNTGEEAYFDNIVEVLYKEDGSTQTLVNEDFEAASNYFISAKIEEHDGSMMCHMQSSSGEKKLMQLSTDGVPMFRKSFTIDKKVSSAKLYTSALGVYDLYINGKRVGHVQADGSTVYEELKPGFVDFRSREFYSSHDVTSLLQEGKNAIGAIVTSGWYSGGIAHNIAGNDKDLGLIAKLVVTFDDGSTQAIVSDNTWASSKKGAMLYSDIYNGEIYDARLYKDFSAADFDASGWNAVTVDNAFHGKLESFKGPFVEVLKNEIQTVKSSTIYEGTKQTGTDFGEANVVSTQSGAGSVNLKKGQTVCFDFGQNIVGWPSFTVKGKAGSRVHFVLTEMLNDNGSKSRGNDGAGGTPYLANLRSARAEVYYFLDGNEKGESWHPFTAFYGFRYCTVTATDDIEIEKIEAMPISSSNEDTGSISTSSPSINQLISNINWGQRGNLLSAPTDCPQRDERQGWTADTQVYAQTGMYNANMETFYNKWLGDMRDGQRNDGAFPDIAPQTGYAPYGGAAWSDAGIIVPWKVYIMYGNKSVISDNYAAMEKYMDWLSAQTGDGEYQGALTTYGDWVAYAETDRRYISMVYYAHDAELMAKMSKALSTSDNDVYAQKAQKYEMLFENIRNAIQKRYFYSSGNPKQTSQCALVLALNFNIFKDAAQKKVLIDRLDDVLNNANDVLNTGFLGTSVLNQTLSEVSLNDHAYNLLLQRKNPSWLYPIDQGATTMWERWDSYTKDKGFQTPIMNSFNHYAYGAIGEWMYRFMSGIETDDSKPGFKHIILQPAPDFRKAIPANEEQITYVRGSYDSNYGRIESNWEIAGDSTVNYSCVVPVNTTATLYLPCDTAMAKCFRDGTAKIDTTGITYQGYENGKVVLHLGSGSYSFPHSVLSGIRDVVKVSSLKVYPNPVRETLNIVCDDVVKDVKLFSVSGNMLKHVVGNVKQLNVVDLPNGIYLLKATSSSNELMTKIIKR